jgi:hypothetical protein
MLLLLLFFFLNCGPDQWTLVPLAIGQDIHFGPPCTSLAASAASSRLACVRVLGDTPLQPPRAHYYSKAQCDTTRIASPSLSLHFNTSGDKQSLTNQIFIFFKLIYCAMRN